MVFVSENWNGSQNLFKTTCFPSILSLLRWIAWCYLEQVKTCGPRFYCHFLDIQSTNCPHSFINVFIMYLTFAPSFTTSSKVILLIYKTLKGLSLHLECLSELGIPHKKSKWCIRLEKPGEFPQDDALLRIIRKG